MATDITDCRVLVVGGCGYLGYRIIRWLVHECKMPPSQITSVDIIDPAADREEMLVEYLLADMTDKKAISDAINKVKPEVIIHTASPAANLSNLNMFMRNNVEGTRNLLDAAVAQPSVKVFVFTSSSSVSHDSISDLSEGTEEDPYVFLPQQRQTYSHSKAVAEQLSLSYNRKREDFVTGVIRPSALFGPAEPITTVIFLDLAKKGNLRWQIGDGKNATDFTYVDNAVIGHILLINGLLKAVAHTEPVPEDMRLEGEAFLITDDEHRGFWTFFRDFGAAAGYPTDPNKIVSVPKGLAVGAAGVIERLYVAFTFGNKASPVRQVDLAYSAIERTFNIAKAKKRLGYTPRFSVEEGIQLSVAPILEAKTHE